MPGSKKSTSRTLRPPRRSKSRKLPCAYLTPFDIRIADCDGVNDYVFHHPDLASPLEGICASLRKAFGPKAELALEVYKDPEVHDHYLTLYVRQAKHNPNIMDRIEAVASPFMSQLDGSSGHLLITTDFRRPRG